MSKLFTYGILMDKNTMKYFNDEAKREDSYTLKGFKRVYAVNAYALPDKDSSITGVIYSGITDWTTLDALEGVHYNHYKRVLLDEGFYIYLKGGDLFGR